MMEETDFSRLAGIYDLLGLLTFCGALHRSQVYFLSSLHQCQRALIMGGGTGKFLIDLLKSGKVDKVTYVDISPGMIVKARRKVQSRGLLSRVEFICGGIADIPAVKFDLVCTHYFLDCFSEADLTKVFAKLKTCLAVQGLWHFSDFYLDKYSSWYERKLLRFLYGFFRVTCGLGVDSLADFSKFFDSYKLRIVQEKSFGGGLLRTAVYR